jgi:hypothetical protein
VIEVLDPELKIVWIAGFIALFIGGLVRSNLKAYVKKRYPRVWSGFSDPENVSSLFTPISESGRFEAFIASQKYRDLEDAALNRRVSRSRVVINSALLVFGAAIVFTIYRYSEIGHI